MNKEEFIKKLTNAKSVDDIIALAKENGLEIAPDKAKEIFGIEEILSPKTAKEIFDKINELSDDELEGAAGGKGLYWIGVF